MWERFSPGLDFQNEFEKWICYFWTQKRIWVHNFLLWLLLLTCVNLFLLVAIGALGMGAPSLGILLFTLLVVGGFICRVYAFHTPLPCKYSSLTYSDPIFLQTWNLHHHQARINEDMYVGLLFESYQISFCANLKCDSSITSLSSIPTSPNSFGAPLCGPGVHVSSFPLIPNYTATHSMSWFYLLNLIN